MFRFREIAIALCSLFLLTPAFSQNYSLQGVVAPGVPLAPSISWSGDVGSGFYFGGVNRAGITGHLESAQRGGVVPTATICGAQPDAGSSDSAGSITNVGTTTCTITFGTAYAVKPSCVVSDNTTNRATMVAIASTTALTITGITAADALSWVCIAKSGG